jgi:hypothetical protein
MATMSMNLMSTPSFGKENTQSSRGAKDFAAAKATKRTFGSNLTNQEKNKGLSNRQALKTPQQKQQQQQRKGLSARSVNKEKSSTQKV